MTTFTKEDIEARIDKVQYHIFEETCVTVCCITLDNGHSEIGESVCVNPDDFDVQAGQIYSYAEALGKFCGPLAFSIREKKFEAG